MILSCPDAIAKTIEKYLEGSNGNGNGNGNGHVEDDLSIVDPIVAKAVAAAPAQAAPQVAVMEDREMMTDMCPQCPDCGSMVDFSEGCIVCKSCGYSKCW